MRSMSSLEYLHLNIKISTFDIIPTHLCTLLDIACGALFVVSALVLVDGCAAVLGDALAFVVIHGAALLLGEHLNNNDDEESSLKIWTKSL